MFLILKSLINNKAIKLSSFKGFPISKQPIKRHNNAARRRDDNNNNSAASNNKHTIIANDEQKTHGQSNASTVSLTYNLDAQLL